MSTEDDDELIEAIRVDVTQYAEHLYHNYELLSFDGIFVITTHNGQNVTVKVTRGVNDAEAEDAEEGVEVPQPEVEQQEQEEFAEEKIQEHSEQEEQENVVKAEQLEELCGNNIEIENDEFQVIHLVEQDSDAEEVAAIMAHDNAEIVYEEASIGDNSDANVTLDPQTGQLTGRKRRASVVFRYSKRGSRGNKFSRSVVGPARCDFKNCSFVASNQRSLQSHIAWKHGDRNYQCQYEGKVFPNEAALRRHYERTHHPKDQPSMCAYCEGFRYFTDDELRQHIMTQHPLGDGEDLVPVLTLPIVKKQRTAPSDLGIEDTSSSLLYQCGMCEYQSPNRSAMEKHHLRMHAPKTLKCRYCDLMWSDEKFRMAHEKNHESQKSLICTICGKRLSSKTAVERHNKFFHSGGVREFQCPDCEKTFPTKEVLTAHIQRIHEGRKNYKCANCDYECFSKEQMKQHMTQQHSNYRPYSCTLCDSAFVSGPTYRQHLKKVHNIENAAIPRLQFTGRGSQLRNPKEEEEGDDVPNTAEEDTTVALQCGNELVAVSLNGVETMTTEDGAQVQYVVVGAEGEAVTTAETEDSTITF